MRKLLDWLGRLYGFQVAWNEKPNPKLEGYAYVLINANGEYCERTPMGLVTRNCTTDITRAAWSDRQSMMIGYGSSEWKILEVPQSHVAGPCMPDISFKPFPQAG
jgi:hypothetical protein